jgi:hypothetical protein
MIDRSLLRAGAGLLFCLVAASFVDMCRTPADACAAISIPAVPGPASGSLTLCVLPSDCREDTMTGKIDAAYCADKSAASCPAGSPACPSRCVGVVQSSGLKATVCTWDRDSECTTPEGEKGGHCACAWTVPAGSAIACGCGCGS